METPRQNWRVALFGVSHWHAAMHLDAARHVGAEIVGVFDEDAAKAGAFAAQHGLSAIGFDALLAQKPDVVILMGHPGQVPEQALRIIPEVSALVLEKPAVQSTQQLDIIAQAADRAGCFVAVPFGHRYSPILAHHQVLADANRAGPLVQLHFRIVNGAPQRYRNQGVGWLQDPAISGGGALRNIGIHGIDLILKHATGRLDVVSAQVHNAIHAEPVEDYAHVVLRDEAGVLFTLETGYTFATLAPGGDFEIRMVTTNATMHDRGASAQCATLDDGRIEAIASVPPGLRYRNFLRDTLDRLSADEPPGITLSDYRAAMALIDTIYQRAQS